MGNDHLDFSCLARTSSMTNRALAAGTGLILRLPALVISTFQSAQPRRGLSAAVSVLVLFATVQRSSCWIAMPVVAASRCGLNVDDRPTAGLESGRSLGSHSGSQTVRPAQHFNGLARLRAGGSGRHRRPANRSRRRSETYGPKGWGLGLINNSVSATSGGRRRIACRGATAGRRTSIANLSIGVASAGRKDGLCVVVRHSMPGVVLIAAVSLVVFFNASRVVEAVGIAAGLCFADGGVPVPCRCGRPDIGSDVCCRHQSRSPPS
jgi:hypothetical protein